MLSQDKGATITGQENFSDFILDTVWDKPLRYILSNKVIGFIDSTDVIDVDKLSLLCFLKYLTGN